MESVKEKTVEIAIDIKDVSKTFSSKSGSVLALDKSSFSAERSEFTCIVGPSGCGKSTILKIISGLISASSGEVLLFGKKVTGPRSDVGMVFQTPSLLEWRTILGNIMLPVEILKLNKKEYSKRALELINFTGLSGFENRYPFELSGGMQQRAALCRTLVYDPKVLLMDEPFANLDAFTREKMTLELLRIWERYSKNVVFVTHNIQEAVLLGDRVLTMTARPGRIKNEMRIDLARPRNMRTADSNEFKNYCHFIRGLISEEQDEKTI